MTTRSIVGFDCLALPRHFSGAANYIFALARALLSANERKFPIVVFCKADHLPLFQPLITSRDKLISISLPNRLAQLYFYESGLKKILLREKIALFYATHYICPPPNPAYKIVNTFHDMGFLLYPDYYPRSKRLYFRRMMRHFVSRSQHMIAVSRTTAADLTRLFPHRAGDVSVIYPGTDHLPEAPDSQPFRTNPYFLAVNTFEKRKQIPFLIRVFEQLKSTTALPHRFFIVGHPSNDSKAIKKAVAKSPCRDDIRILKSVNEQELTGFYQNCAMFLNASVYEGFGFTPFEAMRYRRPVLLYGNAALKEIMGEQPFILSHLVADIWVKQIEKMLQTKPVVGPAREILQALSWKAAARRHLQILEAILTTGAPKIVS